MPSADTKRLKFNWYQKSDKAPFIICVDLKCLIEKIAGCKNQPENSNKTKLDKHIPWSFSMSTILSCKIIENKHDVHKVKIVWKSFVNLSGSTQWR